MKKIFFFLSALVAFSQYQYAQTTSWTGAADSCWHNPANWTVGVPSATIDATVGDANFIGYQPTISNAASCRGLVITNVATLHVNTSNDLTVAGGFTNDGVISGDSVSIKFVGNTIVSGNGTAVYDNFKVIAGANITLNKNIYIGGNLTVDGTFSATGKTITFSGNDPSMIGGSGSISLGNVVQNKTGADLTLLIPVTITGSLTLNSGVIHTSAANLLTLTDGSSATAGNAGSYVDGPMKKIGNDVFVFPLGNNGVWARLIISAPALASDAFTAQYFAAPYANTDNIAVSTPVMNNVSKVEYWTCERSAGSSDVSVTLYWEDNVRSDFSDFGNLVVARWNGSAWENESNIGMIPLPQGNITSATQSSFGPFTFGSISDANPMPVELLSFDASANANRHVDLSWETATETNNNYFTVERSTNGISYEVVGTAKGAGMSLVKRSYAYSDAEPHTGVSYYRLKQTDYNGKFSYSDVRIVNLQQGSADMAIFPNPASNDHFNIFLDENTNQELQVTLYNAVGEAIFSETKVNDMPVIRFALDTHGKLSPGIYSVIATSNDNIYRKKLIIK